MNQLSTSKNKAYNLLSIGQRGVGKTVFIIGSYAECNSANHPQSPQQLWFDCQDTQAREKIESILNYVGQNGQYPPPTIKITDFNFSLKCRSGQGNQTLCNFRWWDIPGETCNIHHPEFQKLVLISHGCCMFINTEALVHDSDYLQAVEDMIKQVVAIVSLIKQYSLNYALALIFTKCDLLDDEPLRLLQIKEKLQPMLARLDAVNANYQKFYSAIPIVSDRGAARLKATGAAASLLWLVSELKKNHNLQAQPELGMGLMPHQAELTEKASAGENLFNLNLPLTGRTHLLLLGICLLGVNVSLFLVFASGRLSHPAQLRQTPVKTRTEQLRSSD
jgi:GTPase SAR1 family protein